MREDSGWKIDDPTPTSAAAASSQANRCAAREHQQADQREPHAGSQRERLRTPVRVAPHERLQHRRGQLVGEGDHADLPEIETVARLQHRVERGQQRLQQVVEQVAQAQAEQDDDGGPRRR